jgi:transcriptional regulator with XRE-family HTH domain
MRKALGLRAADLAGLLGVAAETVSRWETGQRDVDRGALALVGGLVVDRLEGSTATLDRLRALAKPPRTAKTKALELARTPKRRAV